MSSSFFSIGERAPWGNFPSIICNDEAGSLSAYPEYASAKAGDTKAAFELISKTLKKSTVISCSTLIKNHSNVVLLPLLAQDVNGNNKIPLAVAEALSNQLNVPFTTDIVQKEKIGRTYRGGDYRLAFNPTFEGKVESSKAYLIIDDTVTMGGTIASLHGHLKNRGADVIGAMTMRVHGLLDLPIQQTLHAELIRAYGSELNDFRNEKFNYGLDKLTQTEATGNTQRCYNLICSGKIRNEYVWFL